MTGNATLRNVTRYPSDRSKHAIDIHRLQAHVMNARKKTHMKFLQKRLEKHLNASWCPYHNLISSLHN